MGTRALALAAVLALAFFSAPIADAADTTVTVVTSGTADTDSGVPIASGTYLIGFSITEDAGSPAAARVRLRHGTDVNGVEMFDVQLAASQSAREWFGPDGPSVSSGLFIDRVSGTTRLTIYTRRF